MKYTLDTLPVLDAYRENGECPLCRLRISCEDQYVDSMLGAAYMEPDCRVKTNEVGFCTRHFELMFERRNRLGLALMTHTHMQQVTRDLKTILSDDGSQKGLLAAFRSGKSEETRAAKIHKRLSGCVICEQVDSTVSRYAYTIAHFMARTPNFSGCLTAQRGSACRTWLLCSIWRKKRFPLRRLTRLPKPSPPWNCRIWNAFQKSWNGSRSNMISAMPTSPGETAAMRWNAPSTN